jgi:sterol desaturase/sphingolipid hydroxylase (fatty acid hydroxylase superfamily)
MPGTKFWQHLSILPDHTHAALGKIPLLASAGYVVFGVLFYWWAARKSEQGFSLIRAVKSLFPVELYTHPSSKVDLVLFPVTVVLPIGLTALGFTALLLTGDSVFVGLQHVFGASPFSISNAGAAIAVQFAVLFLAMDFSNFMYHYLFHKVPLLWRFHRVHHSAEVLTLLTRWRFHPGEVLFDLSFKGPFAGLISGFVFYLLGMKVSAAAATLVAAMNVAFEATYFFRHSHVWVGYGPIASRVFCSPCMHQVHHSIAPKHWDKNMGLMLSIWDYLFNTLYIPEGHEELQFGINGEDIGVHNPHATVGGALIEPVRRRRLAVRPVRTARRRVLLHSRH